MLDKVDLGGGCCPQNYGDRSSPAPAVREVLALAGLELDQMDLIELIEAFAAQALSVTRDLGLDDDDPRINPQGRAITLGHPLGMSGAQLVITALYQLQRSGV